MSDLLKADFYRAIRDIILIIALILLVVFALSTPLLYTFIDLIAADEMSELEQMGFSFVANGKTIFLSSLSLTNNFGIILPVFIAIIVCRDFSSSTVRNKIIAGHKRVPIYASHLVTAVSLGVILFVIYALLNLAFGSLIHGYGVTFNSEELIFIFKALLIGILIFTTAISLAVFLAVLTRSIGLTIVLQIVVTIVASMPNIIIAMLPDASESLKNIFMIFPSYQNSLAMQGAIDGKLLAFTAISSAVYIALITLAGMMIFKKADQK